MKGTQFYDMTQQNSTKKVITGSSDRSQSPEFPRNDAYANLLNRYENSFSSAEYQNRNENTKNNKILIEDGRYKLENSSSKKYRPGEAFQNEASSYLEDEESADYYLNEQQNNFFQTADLKQYPYKSQQGVKSKKIENEDFKKRREEFNRKFFEKRKSKKERSKEEIYENFVGVTKLSDISKRIEEVIAVRTKTPPKKDKLYNCIICNNKSRNQSDRSPGIAHKCNSSPHNDTLNSNEKLQGSIDQRSSHDWRQSSEKLEENRRKILSDTKFLAKAKPGSLRGSLKFSKESVKFCSVTKTESFTYEPESKDEVYRNLKRFLEITEGELQKTDRLNKSYQEQIDKLTDENRAYYTELKNNENKIETIFNFIEKEKQKIKCCLVKNNLKFYDLIIYINNLDEYLKVNSSSEKLFKGLSADTNSLKLKNNSIEQNLIKIQEENEKLIKDLEEGGFSNIFKQEFPDAHIELQKGEIFNLEYSLRSDLEKYKANEEISKKIIERLNKKLTLYEEHLEKLLTQNPNEQKGLKNTIEKLIKHEKKIDSLIEADVNNRKKIDLYEKENKGLKKELENYQNIFKKVELSQQEQLPEFHALSAKYDHVNEYIVKLEGEINQEKMNYLRLYEERELLTRQLEGKENEVENFKVHLNSLLEEKKCKDELLKNSDIEMQKLRESLEEQYNRKLNANEELYNKKLRASQEESEGKLSRIEERYNGIEAERNSLKKNLESSHKTIQELENRLIMLSTGHEVEKLGVNDKEVVTAIEQLSLIILSKDSRSPVMNDNNKRLIKELFGENFSKVIENYEFQTQKLRRDLEQREELLRTKDTKSYSYLKLGINLSDSFIQITDIFERVNVKGVNVLTRLKEKLISQKRELLIKNMELKRDKNIFDEEREKLEMISQLNSSSMEGRTSLTPLFGFIELKAEDQLECAETLYYSKEDFEENLTKIRAENESLKKEIQSVQDKLLKTELEKENLNLQLTQQNLTLKVPEISQVKRTSSNQSLNSNGNSGNQKESQSKSQMEAHQIKINEMNTQIKFLQEKLMEAENSRKGELSLAEYGEKKSLFRERFLEEDDICKIDSDMNFSMILMQAISIEELLNRNGEHEELREEEEEYI